MRSSIVIAVLGLLAAHRVADAQSAPRDDRGISTTIGLSKGAGALTCSFCSGEGKGGIAGVAGIETDYRRGVRIGFEVDWWLHSGGGASRSVLAAAPVAHLYPSGSGPLFFKIGLGLARFAASSDEEELRSTALTGVAGIGYELRLSARSVVIPYVSLLSGTGGTLRLNGALVTPVSGLTLLQYGLALARR